MGLISPSGRIADRPWWVNVEQAVSTTGGSGAPIITWQTLGSIFLAREALTGDERFTADQVSGRQYTKWIGPYAPELDPDLVDVVTERRLTFEGQMFDITRSRRIGPHGSQIELITLASSKDTVL
jgi:head-tail adaptor